MIKREDYVIFRTLESNGHDICIMDNVNRYCLIPEEEISSLLEDIIRLCDKGQWSSPTLPFDKIG